MMLRLVLDVPFEGGAVKESPPILGGVEAREGFRVVRVA